MKAAALCGEQIELLVPCFFSISFSLSLSLSLPLSLSVVAQLVGEVFGINHHQFDGGRKYKHAACRVYSCQDLHHDLVCRSHSLLIAIKHLNRAGRD